MKKLAILASGNGTNAENIVDIFHRGNKIRVSCVVSNNEDAPVLEKMHSRHIPTLYISNSEFKNSPQLFIDEMRKAEIDLIVLAGFMRKIHPDIVAAFEGKIINIHPSLLPAYGGKGMWGHHVHQAVIAAGERQSGVTVHYVTPEIDRGEIVMQQSLEIAEGETAESLEAKIHEIEYSLYPRAIVRALEQQDKAENNDITPSSKETQQSTPVPPPLKQQSTPDSRWAEALNIKYDDKIAVEQPIPPHQTETPTSQCQAAPQIPQMPQLNPAPTVETEPMPSTHLFLSLLMALLCSTIPGIIAIIFSAKVSSRYYAGDMEGSRLASRRAELWIVISFIVGLLSATLYVPLMLIKQAMF